MSTKKCDECKDKITTAFRVRYLPFHYAQKQWVFLCKKCLNEVKPNNPHYKYGGTWKTE